jgi:hypothetical protein
MVYLLKALRMKRDYKLNIKQIPNMEKIVRELWRNTIGKKAYGFNVDNCQ